jgi:hypothetical protein
MGIVTDSIFTCAVCGNDRGDMCPTCWRNGTMLTVGKWKNSTAFLKKLDRDFAKEFGPD